MSRHRKMLIEIGKDGSDEVEIESLWVTPVQAGFKIENIPFYARSLALGDVVKVVKKHDFLYFKKLLRASGHSTIRLIFFRKNLIQTTLNELEAMGCSSEISDIKTLVAVDVPSEKIYKLVKVYLDKGETEGKWEYEEGCLGF
jgi:hypothetical protein